MEVFAPLHPVRLKRLKHYISGLSGLVLYYPMWTKDGVTEQNLAPEYYTFDLYHGAITGALLGRPGKTGLAFTFDGIDDNIDVTPLAAPLPLYPNNTAFSIVFLVRNTDTTQVAKSIYSEGSTAGDNQIYTLRTGSTNAAALQFRVRNDAGGDLETSETSWTLAQNVWATIVLTDNNGTVSIYKDGVASSTNHNYTRGTITNNICYWACLARAVPVNFFKGDLQHCALVNRTLTATEALRIAQIAGTA